GQDRAGIGCAAGNRVITNITSGRAHDVSDRADVGRHRFGAVEHCALTRLQTSDSADSRTSSRLIVHDDNVSHRHIPGVGDGYAESDDPAWDTVSCRAKLGKGQLGSGKDWAGIGRAAGNWV